MRFWALALAPVPFAGGIALSHGDQVGSILAARSPANTSGPNIAQMLCSSFDRPKVAVCLHGAARSFPHVLVHTSMKENLIDAMGADSTVFLHLSLKDARADARKEFGGTFRDVSHQDVQRAADVLGIKREHTAISEERAAALPDCHNFQDNYDIRRSKSQSENHVETLDYLYSLAGQLSHREGCMRLVREEEAVANTTFDSVIIARADITYYSAMPPYCMFNHNKPRRYWDWFYHVPRSQADGLFSEPWRQFYGCHSCMEPEEPIEDYVFRNILSPLPEEDLRIPAMVTRLDQDDMPSNICGRFHLKYGDEKDAGDLCGPMTFKNAYNSMAGPSNV